MPPSRSTKRRDGVIARVNLTTARRLPGSLLAALLAVVALAIGAPRSTAAPQPVALAEHLQVFDRTLASGRMWPTRQGTPLGRGFRCQRQAPAPRPAASPAPPTSRAPTRRICGRIAEATFRLVSVQDRLLQLKLRPPTTLPEQGVQVSVNGTDVARLKLVRGWQDRVVDLPATALRRGANVLRLRFEHTESGGAAVAARVRRLEVIAAAQQRPAHRLEGTVSTSAAGDAIRMSGSAAVRIALQPGDGARFHSRIGRSLSSADPVSVARLQVLSSRPSQGSDALRTYVARGDEADLDLSPWAGEPIVLTLESSGPPGSVIQWRRPQLTGPVLVAGVNAGPLPGPARRMDDSPPELIADNAVVAPEPAGQPADGGPDILLILLDAARRDAISAYGAKRQTPAIDRLAGDGIRFDNAFSTATWTAPAVASILTGLTVPGHGVEDWNTPLRVDSTLAERLAAAGYRTALWSQHVVWHSNPSLRRGFEDVVLEDESDRDRLPAPGLLIAGERPTFALVHLLLPHGPYEPPERFRQRYATGATLDVSPPTLRAFGLSRAPAPSPERIAYTRARYDEMVSWADDRVGVLLDQLRARGRYERTLVILAADHGEAFYEHGHFLHTSVLEREVTGIPLILKPPAQQAAETGRAPRQTLADRRLVSLIDLAPTILAAVGINADPSLRGFDLLGRPRPAALRVLHIASSGRHGKDRRLSLVTAAWHLIYDPAGGTSRLYEIRADPAEAHDLSRTRPVVASWMTQTARSSRTPEDSMKLEPTAVRNQPSTPGRIPAQQNR